MSVARAYDTLIVRVIDGRVATIKLVNGDSLRALIKAHAQALAKRQAVAVR